VRRLIEGIPETAWTPISEIGPDPRRVLDDDPAVECATEVDREQQNQE